MAGEMTLTDVNGLQKRVYDKSGLKNALPGSSINQKAISWENGTRRIGESFQVSVVLQPPNGLTYAGSTGAIATLKQGRPMLIKQASITPFEMELREQMAWAALSRSASEGEGSFASLTGEALKAIKFSASNRVEAATLHGQRGYGTIESVTDLTGQSVDVVITAATWAPGLWWAMGPGSTWDSITLSAGVLTTLNTASGPFIITRVIAATRTLRGTFTGTLSSEMTAGDVLVPEGAFVTSGAVHNDMPGLLLQAANTTGTTLGLSATTYTNWAGNTYDAAGNISWDIVEDAVGQLRDRGISGTAVLQISNKGYGALMQEPRTQRMLDQSYSMDKVNLGHKKAVFHTDAVGDVELLNHPFMKQGEAFLFAYDDCGRVGSSDVQFGTPGSNIDAPVWERVANTNATEVINFSDQCVILKTPSHAMVITGVTFS